jgi:hypothetical protein
MHTALYLNFDVVLISEGRDFSDGGPGMKVCEMRCVSSFISGFSGI